jgi:hypothetical protein
MSPQAVRYVNYEQLKRFYCFDSGYITANYMTFEQWCLICGSRVTSGPWSVLIYSFMFFNNIKSSSHYVV